MLNRVHLNHIGNRDYKQRFLMGMLRCRDSHLVLHGFFPSGDMMEQRKKKKNTSNVVGSNSLVYIKLVHLYTIHSLSHTSISTGYRYRHHIDIVTTTSLVFA